MAATSEVSALIGFCRAAHDRLLATLEGLTDEAARRPSRLPGWTVGHVLTHIARSAESHVRMLQAALRNEAVEQYAGGTRSGKPTSRRERVAARPRSPTTSGTRRDNSRKPGTA